MDRRTFSSMAALTAASYSRILGANDRVNFALIGAGRRGRLVSRAMLKTGEAQLTCLCDLYDAHRTETRKFLGLDAIVPETAIHQETLTRRDVDAVVIAAPDHLHLDLAKDALAASKHIYLEKPCTHSFDEGPELLKAVKASGKVCQVGTQQRSGAHYLQAKEQYFDSGKLGKVVFVRAIWNDFPWQARHVSPAPKPAGLDWDRFLGPAPKVKWDMMRYDSWRCFREYGAGVLADILNHWADVAQWMLDDEIPLNAVTTGGIYKLRDGRSNPDSVSSLLQYKKEWNLQFESTVLSVSNARPSVVFLGTEGTLDIARTGFVFKPNKGDAVVVKTEDTLDLAHAKDFIACLKTGKKPNADIETALRGVVPCHLATEAYWSGKRTRYQAEENTIVGD